MQDPLGCPAHSRNPGGHEPCCCRQVLPPPLCAPSALQLGRCGLSFRFEESGGTLAIWRSPRQGKGVGGHPAALGKFLFHPPPLAPLPSSNRGLLFVLHPGGMRVQGEAGVKSTWSTELRTRGVAVNPLSTAVPSGLPVPLPHTTLAVGVTGEGDRQGQPRESQQFSSTCLVRVLNIQRAVKEVR